VITFWVITFWVITFWVITFWVITFWVIAVSSLGFISHCGFSVVDFFVDLPCFP
jgi:hypothetical protein